MWLLRNQVINTADLSNTAQKLLQQPASAHIASVVVVSLKMSGRDPFPSPKFEDGFTLSGFRPQQRKTYDKPTHIAQMEEPWSRLHDAATLASTRRSVMHCEHQQVANDSLDLQLKSVYDHHQDLFWGKNQILYNKEKVSEVPRKQETLKQDKLEKEEEEIRVWVDPQRHSIYSIK